MCGIITAKNLVDDKPVNNLVKFLYFNQKQRGYEGYGFIGLNRTRITTYRSTTEAGFLGYLNQHQYDEVILHHRLPTSTKNTLETTHPFIIERNHHKYYFLHNGIISNATGLEAKHCRLGIPYSTMSNKDKSFNDSEALAWDFVLWLQNEQPEIQAQGSAAFICLQTDAKTNRAQKLYFYRNARSPLKIYRDKTLLVLSSEANWGSEIKENTLFFYDYATKKVVENIELTVKNTSFVTIDSYQDYSKADDRDIQCTREDILDLEERRDYLLTLGEVAEVEELDRQVESLWNDLAYLMLVTQGPEHHR